MMGLKRLAKRLKPARQFYGWWINSLLALLPESWAARFSGQKGNFDLVIFHQGNSIVIMTDRGKVVETVPLEGQGDIDMNNLPVDETLIERLSNTQIDWAASLTDNQDPPMSADSTGLDIDLTEPGQGVDDETLDIVLGSRPSPQSGRDYAPRVLPPAEKNNVVSLKRQRGEDSTVVLDNDDQTVRFKGPGSDEDTIILKDDQGNLLQFESGVTVSRESTVLFRSYDGKIKPVDPSEFDTAGRQQDQESDDYLPTDEDSGDYAAVVKLLKAYQGKKKCLYLLPESRVFILNLSYPIEAIQNIESVLRYDLEKHIPLSKQEVRYFYALNVDATREKVNAEVAVIKSDEYDLLNLSLEPYMQPGLLCTTEHFYRKYGTQINFLEQPTEQSWRSYLSLPALHLAFNWLLVGVLLATPYLVFYQGANALEGRSADEVERARELVATYNSVTAESTLGAVLSQQIGKAPRVVELLSLLSSGINDKAWIYQFDFKNNEIKIKGEADSATSVSDDLNRTGLFESIKFVSSIVKNARTGQESFELLMILRSDA